MRSLIILVALTLSACSTLSYSPEEIRDLPPGYICEILAPDSTTLVTDEQRIQLYRTLERKNHRCDTAAWARKKAEMAQERECGMKPTVDFDCKVGKCVNGKWEQICR
jgi:hypothetical protein